MRAFIVVDLGFGDAGKGHLVDHLVRRHQAGVVVRYNGGAQAGHNVVTPEGIHHTFSQFGSGSLVPGVKTILSRHVVLHPGALQVEAEVLATKGVQDPLGRIRISDLAIVITPYHQAANRIRELLRSDKKHGSCGVGVGEACEDQIIFPDETIFAGDLLHPKVVKEKLEQVRVRKQKKLIEEGGRQLTSPSIQNEMQIFDFPQLAQNWLESLSNLLKRQLILKEERLYEWLSDSETIVFEGAQGMLIDRHFGFAPFFSWTDSTPKNAHQILEEVNNQGEIETIGVQRCYAVRHGPGPMPTEDPVLNGLIFDHNQENFWQGSVRYGWFDVPLSKYALKNSGGIDTLAITHLDILPKMKRWQFCINYEEPDLLDQYSGLEENSIGEAPLFTHRITQARVIYQQIEASETMVVDKIEEMLNMPVKYSSTGPTHLDVKHISKNL